MRIDVFHDTACPWCRIGKQNMKTALAQWEGEPVEVNYHTFFLNPNIPPEGYDFREYMHAKGGGQVPLNQWFDGPRQAGERAGITFDFEAITKAPNTTLSHQLIAATPGDQREAMIDALYTAYFQNGRDIGDPDVLVEIATANGMTADAARAALEDETLRQQILAEAAHGQRVGVTGVPFFVINNTYAFSGAQPPEVFLQVLNQVSELQGEQS